MSQQLMFGLWWPQFWWLVLMNSIYLALLKWVTQVTLLNLLLQTEYLNKLSITFKIMKSTKLTKLTKLINWSGWRNFKKISEEQNRSCGLRPYIPNCARLNKRHLKSCTTFIHALLTLYTSGILRKWVTMLFLSTILNHLSSDIERK